MYQTVDIKLQASGDQHLDAFDKWTLCIVTPIDSGGLKFRLDIMINNIRPNTQVSNTVFTVLSLDIDYLALKYVLILPLSYNRNRPILYF